MYLSRLVNFCTEGWSQGKGFSVSVNLSRRHFKDPDALAKLQKIAEDNGVPTDLLELELTESILFQ